MQQATTTSSPDRMGLFTRLWLALALLWRVIFDGRLAARVQRALSVPLEGTDGGPVTPSLLTPESREGESTPGEILPDRVSSTGSAAERGTAGAVDATTALQLLAIVQREGRFIDFLQEDISTYSDAEVGAAARVVHEGCKRGLSDYVVIEPVRSEAEGAAVTVEPGFDASRIRVTGRVVGEPPFSGRLAHHGWEVAEIRLPSLSAGHDAKVVAPAEIEL